MYGSCLAARRSNLVGGMRSIYQIWPETILQGTVKGGRRQGRQRKRWEDNIREWTGLVFTKFQRAVENRGKWRKLIAKSSVMPQRPSRLRDRWDEIRCAACCHMTLVRTVKHIFVLFSFAFVHSFLYALKKKKLVLTNRRNNPRYQRVLSLMCFFFFLTWAIPQELILREFLFGVCVCTFCFVWNCGGTHFCRFLKICGLMTCV